jgi:hypothetical protein
MLILLLVNWVVSLYISQQPLVPKQVDTETVIWCTAKTDIFKPSTIALFPDPPIRGQKLKLTLNGTLSENVGLGSITHVKAKLGYIQLIDHNYDMCEEAEKAGRHCPFKKGWLSVTHEVDIPFQMPPGLYRIHVNAFLEDERQVTCVDVKFKM